jgi:hypothetical protein
MKDFEYLRELYTVDADRVWQCMFLYQHKSYLLAINDHSSILRDYHIISDTTIIRTDYCLNIPTAITLLNNRAFL